MKLSRFYNIFLSPSVKKCVCEKKNVCEKNGKILLHLTLEWKIHKQNKMCKNNLLVSLEFYNLMIRFLPLMSRNFKSEALLKSGSTLHPSVMKSSCCQFRQVSIVLSILNFAWRFLKQLGTNYKVQHLYNHYQKVSMSI